MESLAPITEPNATFRPEAVNHHSGLTGRTGQQQESTERNASAQSADPFPGDAVQLSLSPAAQEATEKENGNHENGHISKTSPFALNGSTQEQAQQAAAENALLEKQSSEEKDKEESKQRAEETREEKKKEEQEEQEVKELKRRDQEVRAHEMAHLGAAGAHARGGVQLSYESGPDGRRYATGGHVNIDTSAEPSPEETVQKMQQVQAAAMAPAQPSPADMQVAQKAAQTMAEAQAELSAEQADRDGALPPVEASGSQEQSQSFGDDDASPDKEGQASDRRDQQDANDAQPDGSKSSKKADQNQPVTSQTVPDNAAPTDHAGVNRSNSDFEPRQSQDYDQETDQNDTAENNGYSGQTTEKLEETASFSHRQIASAYNRGGSNRAHSNATVINLIA